MFTSFSGGIAARSSWRHFRKNLGFPLGEKRQATNVHQGCEGKSYAFSVTSPKLLSRQCSPAFAAALPLDLLGDTFGKANPFRSAKAARRECSPGLRG